MLLPPVRTGAARPPSRAGDSRAAPARCGARSVSGCSLTPVIATLRAAMSFSRAASVGLICSATQPPTTALIMPPCASICWNIAQARLGDFVGIPLDVPGAAGRIDHLCQMAFLGEDELRVARVPATGLGRQAGRRVERRGGDDVGASHRAGIAGDGIAQDVERLVARGQHAPAGGDAQGASSGPATLPPHGAMTSAQSLRGARGSWRSRGRSGSPTRC